MSLETQSGWPVPQRALPHRISLLAVIAGYVACFQWIYIHYLYPVFDYFGYGYNPPASSQLILAWFLSVLPSLWMPMELQRPSQLAYWILYLMVLIPSMFVPMYAALNPASEITVLMLVLSLGFAIVGTSYLFPLLPMRASRLPLRAFWKTFALVAASLVIWLVAVFHGNMQLVSFDNIYDLRQAASDTLDQSFANYSYMWLSGAINPFLMGWGLYTSRRWLFLLGALGQVLVYSVLATKSSLLSIVFLCGFYCLFKIRRIPFALNFTLAALLILGGMSLYYWITGENPGLLQLVLLAVVVQRTFSSAGLATAQYYDFFQRNPLTHLASVKGISWFVHYPYKYSIGQEIGLAYAGTTDLDATAHFWATDGLEAFGLPGILFISVLCALLFWVLDSAAQNHHVRLTALVISFAALNLANASIFTSLLSGGLLVLMILMYFLPPTADPRSVSLLPPVSTVGETF